MTWKLDCSDCLDYLCGLESESVDLVLVDPPYYLGYDDGTGWDSQWESESEYLDWYRTWVLECVRVSKSSRMLIFWGSTKTDTFYRVKLEILGKIPELKSQNSIIWSYNWGGRTRKNFPLKHETAWCYSKGSEFPWYPVYVPRKMNTNIRTGMNYETGTVPTCVWEGNLVTASVEAQESRFHPTVKPQFVLDRIIRAYTQLEDTVLDCFSGSGSTAIAAVLAGRNFVGCDVSEKYVEESKKRLEKRIGLLNFES